MIGENGTPETPDWSLTNVVRVSPEEWDWMMRPDTDDEIPAGLRALVLETRALKDACHCDACQRHEVDGYGVYPLPERIELGEN